MRIDNTYFDDGIMIVVHPRFQRFLTNKLI